MILDSVRSWSWVRAWEPRPLLTLMTAGAADRRSSGRNACVTRTTLIAFVLNTSVASAPVRSPAGIRGPVMPALLMSRSMRPSCASTSAAAAATDTSSVTSIGTNLTPSRSAAASPRCLSRAPTGVSVDYVIRLEQGRAATPSGQVVMDTVRVLCLQVGGVCLCHVVDGYRPADGVRVHEKRHVLPLSCARVMPAFPGNPAVLALAAVLAGPAPGAAALSLGDPTPAITVAGGNSVIAVQTSADTLLFYWNNYGTNTWHREEVAGAGSTHSAPAIAQDGDTVIIAAQGAGNSLDFYWQQIGTTPWHPELVKQAVADGVPAIVAGTLLNGADGVNIIAPGPTLTLIDYTAANGTADWAPHVVDGIFSNGSAATGTMNNGSLNVAAFGPESSLDFYWQNNNDFGAFEEETIEAAGVDWPTGL